MLKLEGSSVKGLWEFSILLGNSFNYYKKARKEKILQFAGTNQREYIKFSFTIKSCFFYSKYMVKKTKKHTKGWGKYLQYVSIDR